MEKITISTILEEFEDIGMVKALKSARDFDSFQYKLLLRLFKEYLISALKLYSEAVRDDFKENWDTRNVSLTTGSGTRIDGITVVPLSQIVNRAKNQEQKEKEFWKNKS